MSISAVILMCAAIHAHGTRCPWRRVAKDAISTFFDSPEFQTLLDDVYDEGYDAAEKDDRGENEGEEPR